MDCTTGPRPEARCLQGPTARRGPGASHPCRKSPGFSALATPLRARTHARARTLSYSRTHNKRKPCRRVPEVARALREAPPPGPPPRRPGPARSLEPAPRARGCADSEARVPPAQPASLRSAALAGSCGGSGPTMRAAPPAAEPSSGEIAGGPGLPTGGLGGLPTSRVLKK